MRSQTCKKNLDVCLNLQLQLLNSFLKKMCLSVPLQHGVNEQFMIVLLCCLSLKLVRLYSYETSIKLNKKLVMYSCIIIPFTIVFLLIHNVMMYCINLCTSYHCASRVSYLMVYGLFSLLKVLQDGEVWHDWYWNKP